ncbi:MAG: hypothetical protein IID44_21875 [Planctomycetes bacterium]|nr:hypothetical protein [Planctomycetota bacterium]
MAKLKHDPITAADLTDFLDNHSDFAFEIDVLNSLLAQGFECEHGGSYVDPYTKKPREFDLRATKVFGRRIIRLAVECKNLKSSFPLLITCLPRKHEESFHEVAISIDPQTVTLSPSEIMRARAFELSAKGIRLSGEHFIYATGAPVGKSSDQIGRNLDGAIVANDSDVYSKWAQALSSAQELIDRACCDAETREGEWYVSVVIPVLVVPDAMPWKVDYDANGRRLDKPHNTPRCSYFIQMSYLAGSNIIGTTYNISHLEFVTLAGLVELIDDLSGSEARLDATFPMEAIAETAQQSS